MHSWGSQHGQLAPSAWESFITAALNQEPALNLAGSFLTFSFENLEPLHSPILSNIQPAYGWELGASLLFALRSRNQLERHSYQSKFFPPNVHISHQGQLAGFITAAQPVALTWTSSMWHRPYCGIFLSFIRTSLLAWHSQESFQPHIALTSNLPNFANPLSPNISFTRAFMILLNQDSWSKSLLNLGAALTPSTKCVSCGGAQLNGVCGRGRL